MTEYKKIKLKRLIFPAGIFLLMFVSQSILGTAGVISYFYFSGKKSISDIESYTVNYSKTMAEAFARVAEFSYSSKNYSSLKTLFHEKIEQNTIDEAFFVLSDGKLIVHSSTTAEKQLRWNIATDEMAYNLDMILLPVHSKSRDLLLNNYNIVDKTVPFKRQERDLLKKYIYKDINSTGWLFTKSVFNKDKPVGTVNFIISKERVYASIQESINHARYYSLLIITISMALSFFIALIVLFRYRSIQKNALGYSKENISPVHADLPLPAALTAETPEENEEIMFFPPDSNYIDPVMDFVIEDNFDKNIIDEDGSVSSARDSFPARISAELIETDKTEIEPDEDEYITVELLGEIEPETEPEKPLFIPEQIKEYIAPVISLEDYKNSLNNEIRDAIPIRKKR